MNQDPVMQGGTTPNQGNQPLDTNPNAAAAGAGTPPSGNLPDWMANNPSAVTDTTGSVVEPATPPKKKHKGLAIFIIILLILLLGLGGLAAWYFLYYNNPDKIAYDAINGFLKQQTVVSDGVFTGKAKIDDGEVLITVGLDNKSTTKSGDSTVNVKVSMLDANGDLLTDNQYEVELGGIIMEDGVMYFRTGKLMDSIDTFLEDMSVTIDELDDSMRTVYKLLNNVDGEWWQISVPDVIDSVIEDSNLAHSSKEFYSCLLNVAHGDTNSEIASIYNDNRFIGLVAKDHNGGITDYNVNIDYDKMASFANAMIESSSAKDAENCMHKYIVEDLGGTLELDKTPTSADKIRESLEGTEFTFGIRDFGHELVSTSISTKQGDTEFFGGLEFTHPEVTIEAPENYRPISDLVDMIIDAIMELASSEQGDDVDYIYDEATGEWIIIGDDITEDNIAEV